MKCLQPLTFPWPDMWSFKSWKFKYYIVLKSTITHIVFGICVTLVLGVSFAVINILEIYNFVFLRTFIIPSMFLSVAPCIGQLKSLDVTEVLFKPRSKFYAKIHIAMLALSFTQVRSMSLLRRLSSLIIKSRPREIFLLNTFIFRRCMNVAQLCH